MNNRINVVQGGAANNISDPVCEELRYWFGICRFVFQELNSEGVKRENKFTQEGFFPPRNFAGIHHRHHGHVRLGQRIQG